MKDYPWLFPKLLMIANEEKLGHRIELEKMEPFWKYIKDPVYFIHSTADNLVFPENVDFALKNICPDVPVDTLWIKDGEHSLYWSERELFKQKINEFLDGAILPLQGG